MEKIEHKIENDEGVLNTIIITCAHGEYIERCLKTLNDTIDRPKHRIVFIEGPSQNERPILYDVVKPYIDVYVRTEKNYGFSQSVNLGMAWVRTDYFTVIHDDVWFLHKGWWEETVQELVEDPDIIMVQPFQRFRREETPLKEFPTEQEYQTMLQETLGGSVSEIYCMIFKKEWIDLIGFFDESIYPVGPEDIEFHRLARAVNKRLCVSRKSLVYHIGAGRGGGESGGPRNDRNMTYDIVKKWNGDPLLVHGGATHGNVVSPVLPNILKQL